MITIVAPPTTVIVHISPTWTMITMQYNSYMEVSFYESSLKICTLKHHPESSEHKEECSVNKSIPWWYCINQWHNIDIANIVMFITYTDTYATEDLGIVLKQSTGFTEIIGSQLRNNKTLQHSCNLNVQCGAIQNLVLTSNFAMQTVGANTA